MWEGFLISLSAAIVFELLSRSIWGRSFFNFLLRKTRLQPPPLSDISGHAEVKEYLKNSVEQMERRNSGWSDGFGKIYVELAADVKQEKSRAQNISREMGGILDMPRIFPIISELKEQADQLPGGIEVPSMTGLNTRRVSSILRELKSQSLPIVVLGEPGSGKSTTLRELAISLANRALRIPGAPIPIYVELGKFRDPMGEQPNDAIINVIRSSIPPGVTNLRQSIQSSGFTVPVVVIFDGMDEMPRKGDYGQRTRALASFADDYFPMVLTVFACRTNDFDPSFGHRQFIIEAFNRSRVKKFIVKSLGKNVEIDGKIEKSTSIANRLMRPDELGSDAQNPLTLSMAVRYMYTEKKWPKGRVALFQNHVVTLAQIAFLRQDENAMIDEERIVQLVDKWSAVAYEIFKSQAAVYADTNNLIDATSEETLQLALEGGLLVKDENGSQVRFLHHRLQEFLVARRLQLPNPPTPKWDEILQSPRWQETLLNFFAIGGHNDQILDIVIQELTPASDYFEKLLPLLQEGEVKESEAKRRVDWIEPDQVQSAGQGGVIRTYSSAQRARKDKAEEELERIKAHNAEMRVISIDKEMMWTDIILFTSRLLAALHSSVIANKLILKLGAIYAPMIEFGRPSAQVRMLSAWKEIPDLIDPKALDPVRRSSINWVRAHAINIISSVPVGKNRVGFDFVNELRNEILNLRFLRSFTLFWEVAGLNYRNRLLSLVGLLGHGLINVAALLPLYITGDQLVNANLEFSFLNDSGSLLSVEINWLIWIVIVVIGATLTLPAIRCPVVMRLVISHAVLGGILVGVCHNFIWEHESSYYNIVFTTFKFSHAFIIGAIPGFLSGSLIIVSVFFLNAVLVFSKSNRASKIVEYARIIPFKSTTIPSVLGLLALGIVILATAIQWISKLTIPSWVGTIIGTTFGIVIGLLGVAVILSILVEFLNHLKGLWKENKGKSWFKRVGYFIFSILWPLVLFAGLLAAGICILWLLKWVFAAIVFVGLGVLSITLVLLAAVVLYFFFSWLFGYTKSAFGTTWSELRFVLWRRSRRVIYKGTLAEWEASFKTASETKRKELLAIFDHQAMGIEPELAILTLTRVEGLIKPESSASEPFYKVLYNIQETIRQQKWSDME